MDSLSFMVQRAAVIKYLREHGSEAIIDKIRPIGFTDFEVDTIEYGYGRPDIRQTFRVSGDYVQWSSGWCFV